MLPQTHLLIHNLLSVMSIIAILGMIIFTYFNGPRKIENIAWCFTLFFLEIFFVSHLIGTNIADPILSRNIFMLNISMFFIGSFNIHAFYALAGKVREKRVMIIIFHSAAVFMTILLLMNLDGFLMPSIPKMYFINYYNPGVLNWFRIAFLYGICIPQSIYILYREYKERENILEKKAFGSLIITTIIAYSIAFIPNLLVYDIKVDPIWGMGSAVIFIFPFIYGSVKYGIFNVKIVAKQAFFYSIAVFLVGGFITLLNYLNQNIQNIFPNFPVWVTPLVSSLMAVTIGVIVWRKLRQGDLLKYEFITTVTHKFRTPLTHIKWASENLSKTNLQEDGREQLEYIESANNKLVELTALLMNVSETENKSYEYQMIQNDLSLGIDQVILSLTDQLNIKHIHIFKNIEPNLYTKFDMTRIKFIIQTLVENAMHYTDENGQLSISATTDGKNITCRVKDNGIGIPKEEIPLLFTKFYRGQRARLADTEGMGIGLYISKEIIGRHSGKIWVESEGIGKGSTFVFTLPIKK